MLSPEGPAVRLKRLTVEEGFLDGLDLNFGDGLNVIVGPRGSGKTSIIEVIRFCLGVPSLTDRMAKEARRHALSVLESGRATLTVEVDGEEHVVVRTAEDAWQPPAWIHGVVVLSQNEIEHVATEASGRLALVDSFIVDSTAGEAAARLKAKLRSLTAEARVLQAEIDQLQSQLGDRADAEAELAAAELEQSELLQTLEATAEDQRELGDLQKSLAASSTRKALYDRTQLAIAAWQEEIGLLARSAPTIEDWPPAAGGPDRLAPVRTNISEASRGLTAVTLQLDAALIAIETAETSERDERVAASEATRRIRQRLEEMRAGAGAVARRVTELRELAGQASALRSLVAEREQRYREVSANRRTQYGALEDLRAVRTLQRSEVASRLQMTLAPKIQMSIGGSEALEAYVSAIGGALRGSGLHFSSLANLIADSVKPLELVEMVEQGSALGLAQAVAIPLDRAVKAIDAMRVAGMESIVAADVEDRVDIALQVTSAEWRQSDRLSTGQRCTVVLPIVLSRRYHPILVDQPEDNLDNAYVADTVVAALRARSPGNQYVLATHNPNIPVLGEADQVVVLSSDGSRSKIESAEPLLDARSIAAITSIMEGGREAFAARAKLYGLP